MKFIIALIITTTVASAQTSVDKLVEQLEFLSKGSLNNWKYSTSFAGDPTKPDFDESGWKNLQLDQSIFPDSCWIRKEIVLPERMLGEPIKGTVKFLVSVDDYGFLWVNGESKGHFPWDGEFILTNDGKPGQKFLIAIKAINTGGPLRLIRAQIQSETSNDLRGLVEDFSLSLRVGQKLLGFDTYQSNARKKEDPHIDKSKANRAEKQRLYDLLQSVATKVDVGALGNGDVQKFKASIEEARNQLKPVATFVKRFTLYFNSNAHIDAAWLWREKETIEVCKNTFASVINMMNARPDFTYTQSAAVYYDWMERFYPSLFEQMKARVKEGRWEVTGGMWVEPDCNLPAGESWARHLLYSKRYFKQKLGVDVKIGWNPDSFGYNWNMPEMYQQAGIDAFVTQKIGWNDTNVFPHRVFWWESPDGSRILSYFPFDYVNTVEDGYQLIDWLRQFEANTGFTKMLILFGVGNHGGGPSLEMLARIDRLKRLDIFPNIEYGTTTTFLNWLKSQDLTTLPTWKDELYLEYHQGTYTTQSRIKERNRQSEVLLTNAEKFSALASSFGRKYNSTDLESAWRLVLFNQFHDILPGSGIREIYIDANEGYDDAQAIGEFELNGSLQYLANSVNTSAIKKGTPIIVFNSLGWERNDIVTLALPAGDDVAYSVFDLSGKEITSQKVVNSKYDAEIIFMAEQVPSYGYKTYELRKVEPSINQTSANIEGVTLSNQFFSIGIDPDSGWISSIRDERQHKELITGYGNELQLLEDRPNAWDAWNIGLTGTKYPSTFRGMDIIEHGPVRTIIRLHRDYLKPGTKKDFPTEDFPSSFFTQDIILYNGLGRIDFKTDVDWWEEKTMLKVAFPLSVTDTVATYDMPYGTIQRSTQLRTSWEKAKVEVPAQRWADVSASGYGVSLMTKSKYGFDIKGNVMRLSLLRSPKWPDPTADRGKHSIEYALYPHDKTWKEAATIQRAMEYNNPLIAMTVDRHIGTLPSSYSFVKCTPSNIILTSIKKEEEGNGWILQWYESEGKATEAVIEFLGKPKKVCRSNFLEEDGEAVIFNSKTVTVPTRANSVVTLKVLF